jgi:CheY-like chemotaxis protein
MDTRVLTSNMSEGFYELVRDALSHLYDTVYLQSHPLVDLLNLRETSRNPVSRARALRQVLIDAVESLNPGKPYSLQSRQARSYHLLRLRYLEEVKTADVMRHLALSERQLYRELDRAVEAIGAILWERSDASVQAALAPAAEAHAPVPGIAGSPDADTTPRAISVHSEAERVSTREGEQWLNLLDVVQKVLTELAPLLADRRISLTFHLPQPQPDGQTGLLVLANRTLLRQALFTILTTVAAGENDMDISLACEQVDHYALLKITIVSRRELPPQGAPGGLCARLQQSHTVQALVSALGAELSCDTRAQAGQADVMATLRIRAGQRNVLIIDDNADTAALFRRYLATEEYRLFDARDAGQGMDWIEQSGLPVHLILLDIMMPRQDGWEVLQKLKTHPATQDIPVVICSVLDQPEIALALGATAFLKKPVSQAELIQALSRWSRPAD